MTTTCCAMWLRRALSVLSFVFLILIGTGFSQELNASEAGTSSRPRSATYRIQKGDKLSVKFAYQPELNELLVLVRPDGFISLQMIDDLRAEGLTVSELRRAIEEAYNEQLLRPEVTVSLVEFVAPRVFVGGQVQKPGSYELRSARTVMQAVIVAGGFTREAHRRMVVHARPAGAGEMKVEVLDLQTLLSSKGTGQERELQDGDYIFVPDSKMSKVTQVLQAFQFLVPNFAIR